MRLKEIREDFYPSPEEGGPAKDPWGWDKVQGTFAITIGSKHGKHVEKRGMSFRDAKLLLNRRVGDYQSDMKDTHPSVDWAEDGRSATITDQINKVSIEFSIVPDEAAGELIQRNKR